MLQAGQPVVGFVTLPVRRVSEEEIREVFNAGRYEERLASNDLFQAVESSNPAKAPFLPVGSRTEMVWYFDSKTLKRVALVHQYVLPDGTIGASGKPDPKRIILVDEILQVAPKFRTS